MSLERNSFIMGFGVGAFLMLGFTAWFVPPPGGEKLFTSQVVEERSSAFNVKDCFVRRGQLEPWQSYVDGIIWKVGIHHYLVVPAEVASTMALDGHRERWQSQTLPKDFVETVYQKTKCPSSWRALLK